jgi:hypothetical protein
VREEEKRLLRVFCHRTSNQHRDVRLALPKGVAEPLERGHSYRRVEAVMLNVETRLLEKGASDSMCSRNSFHGLDDEVEV